MHALLVVNPKATATTARTRDVLARALGSDLKVDVVETQRRGHAIELGAQATDEGLDLVVVLGGDGTINEVVNGILRGSNGTPGPQSDQPALAVVPGGSTNVFSRALDLPHDAVEATGSLLDALREGRSRWIGLGRADERWFTFTAGLGLDADAVRVVEKARAAGKNPTPSRYAWAAMSRFLRGTDRRHPAITLERPDEEPMPGLYLGIVSNTTPWTYFNDRPVTISAAASFDNGLHLAALRQIRRGKLGRGKLGVVRTLWSAGGMLTSRGLRGRQVLSLADLREFTLAADRPLHLQVDGDYLGERESVHFHSVPAAIRVVC